MGIISAAKSRLGHHPALTGLFGSVLPKAFLVGDVAKLGPKLAACAKELKGGTRRPNAKLIAPLLAAALLAVYVASPLDLIADFIPILGWLDDLALCNIAVALAKSALEKTEGPQENITEKLNAALEKLRGLRKSAEAEPQSEPSTESQT